MTRIPRVRHKNWDVNLKKKRHKNTIEPKTMNIAFLMLKQHSIINIHLLNIYCNTINTLIDHL